MTVSVPSVHVPGATATGPVLSPADAHARAMAILSLRAAIHTHATNLATLAEGLAEAFIKAPTEREAIGRIADAADTTIRSLVELMGAERHISPQGV